MKTAVITVVHGRTTHLRNLCGACKAASSRPNSM